MVDLKDKKIEREYIIPLRRFWLNVPQYERTGNAVKTIKKFIAKHMKVEDRDVSKVKLDIYFNNELWFRGRANPPSKVKVKAIKEGEIIKVNLVEEPSHIKFLKAKHERIHKSADKKEIKEEKKEETKTEEKTEEQKTDEKEKEIAVEQQNIKQAEQKVKAEKHTGKVSKDKSSTKQRQVLSRH